MPRPGSFTAAHSRRLGAFLADPARPAGTLTYPELCGFLFAVATAPELIRPAEWLPLVFNEQEATYADLAQAQEILGLVMDLYNFVNEGVLGAPRRTPRLPPGCGWRTPALRNQEEDAPLHRWAQGFTMGYDWLTEVWDAYLPDEEGEDDASAELGAVLLTLSFFASRDFAEGVLRELARKGTTLEQFAELVVGDFPGALAYMACFGRSAGAGRGAGRA